MAIGRIDCQHTLTPARMNHNKLLTLHTRTAGAAIERIAASSRPRCSKSELPIAQATTQLPRITIMSDNVREQHAASRTIKICIKWDIDCHLPPPSLYVWHWEHLVLKTLAPFFTFPVSSA